MDGAGPTIDGGTGSPGRRDGRALAVTVGLAVVTVAPLVVAFLALMGRDWVPVGDEAVILFRTEAVGGPDSPLVGVYSTRGWAHPGPVLFYLLALPFRLLGRAPVGLFQATAAINAASVGLVTWLAWRRRGLVGVVVALAFLATLLVGMQPELLVRAWNPYVPLLAYSGFLLAVWSVAERDWVCLPVAIGLASALLQMHVGYAPLVGAAMATAIALGVTAGSGAGRRWPGRAPAAASAAVAALLWLPPLLDQVMGAGNLRRLASYFLVGGGEPVGPSAGLGFLSGHLRPTGPWAGGRERVVFTEVQPETLWWLAGAVVALAATALAARRRSPQAVALPVVALVQVLAGAVAASRLEPPVLSYLLAWMLPLAAFCWFAITFSGLEVARASGGPTADRPRWRSATAALVALASAVVVVQSARVAVAATDPALPRQRYAEAVEHVLGQLDDDLDELDDGRVRVEGVGDAFHEAWVGVVYGLRARGVRFVTSDGAAGQKWGPDHAYEGRSPDVVLTVATSTAARFEDPVRACDRDPAVERVAAWDQLDADAWDRLRELQLESYAAGGAMAPDRRRDLERVTDAAFRLVVYRGSHVCGT